MTNTATKMQTMRPVRMTHPPAFVGNSVCATTMPIYQTGLMRRVEFVGRGIHSGKAVSMRLEPAAPDTGIVFMREDTDTPQIIAHHRNVVDYTRATTISNEHGICVATVEHVLAALAGLQIDNALIFLDGDEVPIMDGSASVFATHICEAGIRTSKVPRTYLQILEPITVKQGDAWAQLVPAGDCSFEVEIDFPNRWIGRQSALFSFDVDNFLTDIAAARTFCCKSDVSDLHRRALGLGGALDNTIVVDAQSGIENKGGLRWPNEIARHKLLDAIGDLYLLGAPILGKYKGFKAGHALNHRLCMKLLDNPQAFMRASLSSKTQNLFAAE